MRAPKAVSFDCAQTLLETDWRIDKFVMACCAEVGLAVGPEAGKLYATMHGQRIGAYLRMNLTKDPAQERAFWRELGADWLTALDADPNLVDSIQEASDRLGFGPDSILFKPYDDVRPCLARLSAQGIPMIVISNWDMSLHRALKAFDLYAPFVHVVASLEEGVEKPNARLFHLSCARLSVAPEDVLHIGDNPVDDLQGARDAGLRAALLDRSANHSSEPVLATLDHLEEAFAWIS